MSCNLFTCGASCLWFIKKCNICEAQQSKMQYIYKVCSFSDNRGLVKGWYSQKVECYADNEVAICLVKW